MAMTIVIVGTVVELGVLGFLSFLWAGRGSELDGSGASPFWRLITLQGWATRVVTLSALVLRACVDFQATVSTGVAAALMLEHGQVPLSVSGRFAILRAVNGGPWSLTGPLLRGWHIRTFGSFSAILLVASLLATIAAQFSSTLLLSDFRQIAMVSDLAAAQMNLIGTNPELLDPIFGEAFPRSSIWTQGLTTYPRFAEAERGPVLPGPNITDTGPVKRVLLPMQAPLRQALRHYTGSAITHESRVTCVAPTLDVAHQRAPNFDSLSRTEQAFAYEIHGNLSWDLGDANLNYLSCGNPDGCTNFGPVRCGIPLGELSTSQGADISILDHTPIAACILPTLNFDIATGTKNTSYVYLLMNSTATIADSISPSGKLNASVGFNEWSTFTLDNPEQGTKWQLNTTLCIATTVLAMEDVLLESTAPALEPPISFDSISRRWNMSGIINQIGLANESSSPSDRGILDLASATPTPDDVIVEMYNRSPGFVPSGPNNATDRVENFLNTLILSIGANGWNEAFVDRPHSVYFCSSCDITGANRTIPHPHYVLLFNEVLRARGPAHATQSFIWWMAQSSYYNALSGFDFGRNATTSYAVDVLVPGGWSGLAAVATIVVVNIICVLILTAMYLRRTRWSSYGNVWHALSQVLSSDTQPILEKAARLRMTDREVNNNLKTLGKGYNDAGIGRVDDVPGSVAIVRRRGRSGSV
jgi:hypothetical protein